MCHPCPVFMFLFSGVGIHLVLLVHAPWRKFTLLRTWGSMTPGAAGVFINSLFLSLSLCVSKKSIPVYQLYSCRSVIYVIFSDHVCVCLSVCLFPHLSCFPPESFFPHRAGCCLAVMHYTCFMLYGAYVGLLTYHLQFLCKCLNT